MNVAIVAGKDCDQEAIRALISRLPPGSMVLIEDKSPALAVVQAAAAARGIECAPPFVPTGKDPRSWYQNREEMIGRADTIATFGTGKAIEHTVKHAAEKVEVRDGAVPVPQQPSAPSHEQTANTSPPAMEKVPPTSAPSQPREEVLSRVAIVADKGHSIEPIKQFIGDLPRGTQVMVEVGLQGKEELQKAAEQSGLSYRHYAPKWTREEGGDVRKGAAFANRERMVRIADRTALFGEGPSVIQAAACARREGKAFVGVAPERAGDPSEDRYRIQRVSGQSHIAEISLRMPRSATSSPEAVAAEIGKQMPTAKKLGVGITVPVRVEPATKDAVMVVLRVPEAAKGQLEKLVREAQHFRPPTETAPEKAPAKLASVSPALAGAAPAAMQDRPSAPTQERSR